MLYSNIGMKKTKGFTLIEMLVGIIVISIISVGAFEFFRHCRRFIVDAELRLSAVNFSRETMEGHSWNTEIAETEDWQDDRDLPAGGEFGSRLYDEYDGARQYKVETKTGTTGDYKIIEVKVSWNY